MVLRSSSSREERLRSGIVVRSSGIGAMVEEAEGQEHEARDSTVMEMSGRIHRYCRTVECGDAPLVEPTPSSQLECEE